MMSIELIRALSKEGMRIFNTDELKKIATSLGVKKSYVLRMASIMIKKGDLVSLQKGLYSLPPELLSGGPLHSFEIGLKLAKKGAISHRSALSYYQLTDQIFSKVYLSVPKEEGANLSNRNDYEIGGAKYHLLRISPEHYWGIKAVFIGETRIWMTNFERTLIDGLTNPDLCGGFREVLFAFERGAYKISPSLIFEYAQKTSLVVCKRLGWVFEELGLFVDLQEKLRALPMLYCQKLDANGKRQGKVIHGWNLLENI